MFVDEVLIKELMHSENYSDLRQTLRKNTYSIKKILTMSSQELGVKSYSFARIWPDYTYTLLTSDLAIVSQYVLRQLWKEDKIFAINNIEPIYDRLSGYSEINRKIYEKIICGFKAKRSIVLEYDLGICKDCHIFLLDMTGRVYTDFELFSQLFDTVLAFYQQYKKQNYKEVSVNFVTEEMLMKDYRYLDLSNHFSPYLDLKEQYGLTGRNLEYISLIALGMSTAQIAAYTNRTARTVEKSISAIRNAFGFDSRHQLDIFLQMFYKSQVKAYLESR